MTVDEVLTELSQCDGYFPQTAVVAAVEQKEAITPRLLAYLQQLVELGEDIDESFDDRLTLFAVFLLAQFREVAAYPLIVRLASDWEGSAEYHFGDAITEGLSRILASVCHGDIALIKKLIEDNRNDEYVRSAALHSLVTLYTEHVLSREDILVYFKHLFRLHPVREPGHLWNALVQCSSAFRFTELLPDIRCAYEEELVDPFFASLASIEKDMLSEFDDLEDLRHDKYFITDTAKELSGWAMFQPKKKPFLPPSVDSYLSDDRYFHGGGTVVRAETKVGRNDPCPCGSGKKYKKCCMS